MDALLITLIITMVISPLIFCPLLLFDGYILPQITIMATGVICALLFLLNKGIFYYNYVMLIVLIYFCYLMLSNLWSTVLENSKKDIPLIFGCLIGFIILITLFIYKANALVYICSAGSIATLLTSIYAILQSKGIDPLFPERIRSRKDEYECIPIEQVAEFCRNDNFIDMRAISTLGNTNFAAGFFICGLPFVLSLGVLIHWSLFALSIIVIWAIVVTKSRAGILSILTSLWFFLVIEAKQGWIVDFIIQLNELELFLFQIILSIAICIIFHKYFFTIKYICKKLSEDTPLNTMLDISNTHKDHFIAHLRYRFRYWSAAWYLIKKRPLFGYGLRTYRREVYGAQAELNKKDKGNFLGSDYQTPQPRECHNDIIENFVEGGFIGGLLFLLIIVIIFAHGLYYFNHTIGTDALLMAIMITGIIGILVDSFFFFPLRLGPSAFYFWIILAIIEFLYINKFNYISSLNYIINPIIIILFGIILFYMLYEFIIKQNIANFYYNRYKFSSILEKKELLLYKCIKYSPKDSIFRTDTVISYMFGFPKVADREAQVLFEHYDGMTPAWSMAYNCGMVAILNHDYLKAVDLFILSLYYYPSFEPSKIQLSKIWPLAPLPNRGVRMKIIDKNAMAFINQCEKSGDDPNITKEQKKILELSVITTIYDEKVRLNIPQDWPFFIERGIFLAPPELTGDHQVMEVGHTKLLIAKRNN